MKLVRIGPSGQERPAIMNSSGNVAFVDHLIDDYNEDFFGSRDGLERLTSASDNLAFAPSADRVGVPVCTPSKLICVGLNYAKHAKEGGMDIPEEPVLFFKAPSAITGPFDQIVIPRGSEKTDWEVELAIVIGQKAKYVDKAHAMDHVFGYVLHNDVSEREFQLERGGQWVKGKSADTFAPIGPWLVT